MTAMPGSVTDAPVATQATSCEGALPAGVEHAVSAGTTAAEREEHRPAPRPRRPGHPRAHAAPAGRSASPHPPASLSGQKSPVTPSCT